jgi:superfamily II DNA or RNA helicase
MSLVQVDMFAAPPRAPMLRDNAPAPEGDTRVPRPYQAQAIANIRAELGRNRSTLLVLPTGGGKTFVFSNVARDWPGNVLVLAHRAELIDQARDDLHEVTGEYVAKEKAETYADRARLVVGSVQTLKGARLEWFAERHPPTLVIVDEAHHAVSPSYRAIFDAFPEAKVLGVTATPDRGDEKALGQVFDSVAFVYEIQDAIRDGYLCQIRVKQVMVGAIDLSNVGTVAGDLHQGELDAVMKAEEVLHGIIAPSGRGDSLIELAGERRTVMFCTSVDAAHRAAEIINRYRPGSARAVDGGTHIDTRKAILRDHKAGRYQFLCNVGVLTEGYDDPGVSCIAMARPTKSRALYAQCAGRGLRIRDGKDDCLLLDFVGNSGKHRLVSALDVLAGKYDDEVIDKARDILEAQGMDGMLAGDALERAQQLVDQAREREAAKRLKLKARGAERVVIERDPFALLDLSNPEEDPRYAAYRAEATEKQVAFLSKKGIQEAEKLSKRQASAIIARLIKNADEGLATYKQVQALRKRGVDTKGMTFTQARRVMDAIAENGWRPLAPARLAQLMERQPGEDG